MSIMSTAIQILSEMCMLENGNNIPKTTTVNIVDQLKEELNHMDSLKESEFVFPVAMVPIRESVRLNKYLIEMEDLSRYMITNHIQSVQEAVGNILNYNGLQGEYHNVALVVDEASILDELAELGLGVDNSKEYGQTGLGTGIWGDQKNVMHYRRLANTKQMLDIFTSRYGLPIVKKNYNVGLMNESTDHFNEGSDECDPTEDVQLKIQPTDQVIHEKPEKNGKESSEDPSFDAEEYADTVNDKGGLFDDMNKVGVNEQTDYEKHIQYLKDLSAGKYDDQL